MDIEPEKVIALVKEKECARNLVAHERNQLIVNTEGAYYYIDTQGKYRLLQGLLPRLKSVYWPESNYFKLRKGQSRERGITKARAAKTPRSERGRGKFQGLVRGTKIHKELKHFLLLRLPPLNHLHPLLHPQLARLLFPL